MLPSTPLRRVARVSRLLGADISVDARLEGDGLIHTTVHGNRLKFIHELRIDRRLAAVSGSIVGAFGSVVGTWITTQAPGPARPAGKANLFAARRCTPQFIAESARLLVDAPGVQFQRSAEIDTGLRAPESHSTLVSSSSVLAEAEEVIKDYIEHISATRISPPSK